MSSSAARAQSLGEELAIASPAATCPTLLDALRGPWGWTQFGIVWGTAAFGVSVMLVDRLRRPLWSTDLYVSMAWFAVIAAAPPLERLPGPSLAWLVADGLSHTLAAVISLLDSRIRYAHVVLAPVLDGPQRLSHAGGGRAQRRMLRASPG